MPWEPFTERQEGVKYKCETCLDYGGVADFSTFDHEGLPYSMACQDCPDRKQDED